MTNITTPTFPAVVFSVTDAGIAELEAKHKGLVVAHGDKKGVWSRKAPDNNSRKSGNEGVTP